MYIHSKTDSHGNRISQLRLLVKHDMFWELKAIYIINYNYIFSKAKEKREKMYAHLFCDAYVTYKCAFSHAFVNEENIFFQNLLAFLLSDAHIHTP